MIIYKILNTINVKSYIGQTKRTPKARFKAHIQAAKQGSKQPLHIAMRKYGYENFCIIPVVKCSSEEEMNSRENTCIRLYSSMSPNGYNVKTGGVHSKYSEESRRKMSEAKKGKPSWNKGIPHTEEHKKNWKESRKGYKATEETKRKQSEAMKGFRHTEETKRKMSRPKSVPRSEEHKNNLSKSLKGRTPWNKGAKGIMTAWNKGKKWAENDNPSSKRRKSFVDQNGKMYTCVNDAANKLNLSKGNIHSVLKGKRKHTKGYTFKYVEKSNGT